MKPKPQPDSNPPITDSLRRTSRRDLGDFSDSRNFNKSIFAQTRMRAKRGFVQVFLLVFLILGVSMWGISEILQRAEKSAQDKITAEVTGLNNARDAVLNYALIAPEDVNIVSHNGGYSALIYKNGETLPSIPYRYFGLPCPDLAYDENLDNVSDIFRANVITRCNFISIETQGLGRLPWRNFSDIEGDNYHYVHGIGGQQLSDSYGNFFWYLPSPNLTFSGNALNPHWIMRHTSDWITVVEGDNRLTVAANVAAVIISPGDRIVSGNPRIIRVANDGVGATDGRPHAVVAQAYLEDGVLEDTINPLTQLTRPGLVISVAAGSQLELDGNLEGSNDKIAYITRDELADISGPGLQALTEGADNIQAKVAGEGDFFGVQEMMESHFNRFYHMPSPAAFNSGNAQNVERLPNLSSISPGDCFTLCVDPPLSPRAIVLPGGVTLRVGAVTDDSGITVEALLPARNLRLVHLQSGSYLAGAETERFDDGLPPYNVALYEMDTALNAEPLAENYASQLASDGFYPTENLFGVNQTGSGSAINSPAVDFIGYPQAALRDRVYLRTQPPSATVRYARSQNVRSTDITLAIAEPVRAFLSGGQLQELLDLYQVSAEDIPRYGVQVQLPTGTRVRTSSSENDSVSLRVPADLQANVVFDAAENAYRLITQLETPVEWIDRTDRLLTVSMVLSRLPILSADSGFLPVDDRPIEFLNTEEIVQLGGFADITVASILQPGKDERFQTPTGTGLPNILAISDLPIDLELYTDHRLIIMPFPPAGRPFAGDTGAALSPLPSPMFINYVKSAASERPFILPTGSQIFYPESARFSVGVNFTFPPGTRALLPAGVVITAELLPGSTIPDGSTVVIPSGQMLVTQAVTMHHGGYIMLAGEPAIIPATSAKGTRVVLRDGAGVGSSQELFDIEIQSPYRNGTQLIGRDSTEVMQPLTGRRQVTKPVIVPENGVVRSQTRVPMRFLTRPRALAMYAGVFGTLASRFTITSIVGERIVADGGGSFIDTVFFTTTVEINDSPRVPNVALGSTDVPMRLVPVVGADVQGREVDVTVNINEQTRFFLPPGNLRDLFTNKVSVVSPNSQRPDSRYENYTRTVLSIFVLPASTGIFDPELNMDLFNVGSVLAWPQLVNPVTLTLVRPIPEAGGRGVVINQLVMLPESDMAIGSQHIPAHSMVDVNQLVAWPPSAVRNMPTAAEDLRVVSQGPMYLYFPSDATLVAARDRQLAALAQQTLTTPTIVVTPLFPSYMLSGPITGSRSLNTMTATFTPFVIRSDVEQAGKNFPAGRTLGTLIITSTAAVYTTVLDFSIVDAGNIGGFPVAETRLLASVRIEQFYPSTTNTVQVLDTFRPRQIEVHVGEALALSLVNTLQGVVLGSATVEEQTFRIPADNFVLPAGTFLIINEGEELDFLSNTRDGAQSPNPLRDADFTLLPEDSVAVLPVGFRFEISTTIATLTAGQRVVTTTIAGVEHGYLAGTLFVDQYCIGLDNNPIEGTVVPRVTCLALTVTTHTPVTLTTDDSAGMYVRFTRDTDNGGGYALVDSGIYMQVSPLVYYPQDAYLSDSERGEAFRSNVVSKIPAGGRGDLYGNVTYRGGYDFAANLLPINTAELLRNFPMVYAVAPDCRVGRGGLECAEGEGQGLEFAAAEDETWVLKNRLEASGDVYITAASPSSPADPNVRMVYMQYGAAGHIGDINAPNTTITANYIYSDASGGITYADGNGTALNNGYAYVVQVAADAPPDTVMRVYVSLTAPPGLVRGTVHALTPELARGHYAEVKQLTIYPGGFVKGREAEATFKVELVSAFDTNGRAPLRLGLGSQLNNIDFLGTPFGAGAAYRYNGVEIPIEDYTLVDQNRVYIAEVRAGGRYTEVDFNGRIAQRYNAGDQFFASESGARLIGQSSSGVVQEAEVVQLRNNASFNPRQGYLWQGYVNVGTEPLTAELSGPSIGEGRGQLRIHSMFSDELNFFGSGLDFPEFLDSRSPVRFQGPGERLRFWMDNGNNTQHGNIGLFSGREETTEDFEFLVNRATHDTETGRSFIRGTRAYGYERLGVDEFDGSRQGGAQGNTSVSGSTWELRNARSFAGRMYPVDRPFGLRAPVAGAPFQAGPSVNDPDRSRFQSQDGTYGFRNPSEGVTKVANRRIWLVARVRKNTGEVEHERVTLRWAPRAVGIKGGGSIPFRQDGPHSYQRNREAYPYDNFMQIGVQSNPYAVHDQLWFNPNDLFAYRQLLDLADPAFYFDRDRNPPPANYRDWVSGGRRGTYGVQELIQIGEEIKTDPADTFIGQLNPTIPADGRFVRTESTARRNGSINAVFNTRHNWKSFDTNARLHPFPVTGGTREARFNMPPYQMLSRLLTRNFLPYHISPDSVFNPSRARARVPVVRMNVHVCPGERGQNERKIARIPGVPLGPGFDVERIYQGAQAPNCTSANQRRTFSFSSRPRRNRFLLNDNYVDQLRAGTAPAISTLTLTVVTSVPRSNVFTIVSTLTQGVPIFATVTQLTITSFIPTTIIVNTYTLNTVTVFEPAVLGGTVTIDLGVAHTYNAITYQISPGNNPQRISRARLIEVATGTQSPIVTYIPPLTFAIATMTISTQMLSISLLADPLTGIITVSVLVTNFDEEVRTTYESITEISTITLFRDDSSTGRSRVRVADVIARGEKPEVVGILDNRPELLNPQIPTALTRDFDSLLSYKVPRAYQPISGRIFPGWSYQPFAGEGIRSGPPFFEGSSSGSFLGDPARILDTALGGATQRRFEIGGGDFFFYLDMAYNTSSEAGRTEDFRESRGNPELGFIRVRNRATRISHFRTRSRGVAGNDFYGQFNQFKNDRIHPDNFPRNPISVGENFRIGVAGESAGAIVPHFGGRNLRSVADVYAARSRLFYDLLGANDKLRLARVYSEATFPCPDDNFGTSITTSFCPQMYNPDNAAYWLPILTGVYTFQHLALNLRARAANETSPDVRLVVPEPEIDIGGVKLPAGSIIYPSSRTNGVATPHALRARTVNGGRSGIAVLHIFGGAVAAVDVSPVHTPKAVYFWRGRPAVRSHDFVFSPVKTWDDPNTPAAEDDYIVEPMFFTQDEIIDFRFYFSGFGGRRNERAQNDHLTEQNIREPIRVAERYRRQACPSKFYSRLVEHYKVDSLNDPFGSYFDRNPTTTEALEWQWRNENYRTGDIDQNLGYASGNTSRDPTNTYNNRFIVNQADCIQALVGLTGEGSHEIRKFGYDVSNRSRRSTGQEKRVAVNQVPNSFRRQDVGTGRAGPACTSNDAKNYEGGCEGYHIAYDVRNGGVRQAVRHDGTWSRGFLMNERTADVMSDYFSGKPAFTPDNGFITYFPRRFYVPDNNLVYNFNAISSSSDVMRLLRLGGYGGRVLNNSPDGGGYTSDRNFPDGPCMWVPPYFFPRGGGTRQAINYPLTPGAGGFGPAIPITSSRENCHGEPSTYVYGYPTYDNEEHLFFGGYYRPEIINRNSGNRIRRSYDTRIAYLPRQQGAYITQPKISKDHHDSVPIQTLLSNGTFTVYGKSFQGYNVQARLNARTSSTRLPMYRPDLVPVDNQTEHVGNPLSWHWLNRDPGQADLGSFIPLGGARQFPVHQRPYLYASVPQAPRSAPEAAQFAARNVGTYPPAFTGVYNGLGCGYGHDGAEYSRYGLRVDYPPNPSLSIEHPDAHPFFTGFGDSLLSTVPANAGGSRAFKDVPCSGQYGQYWVGVRATTSSNAYPEPGSEIDNNEFVALRLPHRIDIPAGQMTIFSFQGTTQNGGAPPYPSEDNAANWIRFPAQTYANILQVDGSSWEAAHPYVSRFMGGAVLANDGGLYPRQELFQSEPSASEQTIDTENARRVLQLAEQFTVPVNNEGKKRINIGGRSLMHYTRSETLPGNHAFSNTPVYTNMWIRLPFGGRIDFTSGPQRITTQINLPPNSIVNPVMGTYIPAERVLPRLNAIYTNYPAYASTQPIEIARPLLVLPVGTTMRIGQGGAKITNVKAAAIFSIAPLDRFMVCAYGSVGSDFVANGLSESLTLSQLREGVDETKYATATGGLEFTLGNPCAWLDDRENTDGDRFFIYRSRRRYVEPARTRIISNDRTFLLGGRLQLLT